MATERPAKRMDVFRDRAARTDEAAKTITDSEVKSRDAKTDRLRKLRMAQDELTALEPKPEKPVKAAKRPAAPKPPAPRKAGKPAAPRG